LLRVGGREKTFWCNLEEETCQGTTGGMGGSRDDFRRKQQKKFFAQRRGGMQRIPNELGGGPERAIIIENGKNSKRKGLGNRNCCGIKR